MIQFYNKALQNKLAKDGYVVVDVLDEKEVLALKQLYDETKDQHLINNEATHTSTDTKNPEFVEYIDKSIEKIIRPKLDQLMEHYDYMLTTYIVKEPGNNNITGFHQDPTLVDQDDKIGANIWIPLQDTDKKNGCLQFIKGSHRFGNLLVVTPDFPTVFEKYRDELPYFLTDVPLKAGQGVVFDNKLIHSANPNHSSSARLAIVSALKSADCDWVYYYRDPESLKVHKYPIDYASYLKYPKGAKPEGEPIGEVAHEFEQKTYSEFVRFMLKNYPLETIGHLAKKLFT